MKKVPKTLYKTVTMVYNTVNRKTSKSEKYCILCSVFHISIYVVDFPYMAKYGKYIQQYIRGKKERNGRNRDSMCRFQ